MSGLVVLLSDFGTRDWYVAAMKGVILSRAPRVQLIDLTHEIPPQDVVAGAFTLSAAAPWFPRGTVFLAVVDPGVGSDRALPDRPRFHARSLGQLCTQCLGKVGPAVGIEHATTVEPVVKLARVKGRKAVTLRQLGEGTTVETVQVGGARTRDPKHGIRV